MSLFFNKMSFFNSYFIGGKGTPSLRYGRSPYQMMEIGLDKKSKMINSKIYCSHFER